jgi:hypothetical protein
LYRISQAVEEGGGDISFLKNNRQYRCRRATRGDAPKFNENNELGGAIIDSGRPLEKPPARQIRD